PDVLKGLGELSHVAHERFLALEVATELRAPATVPDRIIGEQLRNCLEIAAFERLKSVANLLYLLVEAELYSGFRHVRSPLIPFWLDPAVAGMTTPQAPTIGCSVIVSRGMERSGSGRR